MMDHDTAERLALMCSALRPDWPVKSLLTFIRADLGQTTYREAAVMLAWVATDPDTRTPRRVLEQGPWRNATRTEAGTVSVIPTRCGEHPQHVARTCQPCVDEMGPVDHTSGAAQVRAALVDRNKSRHHQGKL